MIHKQFNIATIQGKKYHPNVNYIFSCNIILLCFVFVALSWFFLMVSSITLLAKLNENMVYKLGKGFRSVGKQKLQEVSA